MNGLFEFRWKAVTQCAHHATGAPHGTHHLGDELRAAGLAVGTGHSNHRHCGTGLVEEASCNNADARGEVIHADHGNATSQTEALPSRIGVREHNRRATVDGRINEVAAVMIVAEAREEEIAGLNLATVQLHATDTYIELCRKSFRHGHDATQQLFKACRVHNLLRCVHCLASIKGRSVSLFLRFPCHPAERSEYAWLR